MKLFPAIDLRDGRCVRLYQGDYDQETVYSDNPVDQALAFQNEGAEIIHVVDLDAALTGKATNGDVIGAICQAVDVPVQVGGGVRSETAAETLFGRGVTRVVIGTAALERPELVANLSNAGYAVAVGLDAYGDEVATHGWTKRSGVRVGEMAARFAESGAEALVVTEISRDGTLAGPDVEGLTKLLTETDLPVIASGGVGELKDLNALVGVVATRADDENSVGADASAGRAAKDNIKKLDGVIVGRALYERAFTVTEALAHLAEAGPGMGAEGKR